MKGLFVQLSTTPPGSYLADLIQHLRVQHPEIRELAFSDVQPWAYTWLDHLPLYPEFKVWVGAPPVPWYGPRPDTPPNLQPWMLPVAGAAGMLTPSYRWDQIHTDMALWAYTRERGWNMYIGSEIGIDAIGDHPTLRQGWEAYLIEVIRQSSTSPLWSPYAWDAWATVSEYRRSRIRSALATMIRNIGYFTPRLNLASIDLQDGRGAQPTEPESDAVNWYRLVKDCGVQVRVNMELFAPDLTPLPIDVARQRRAYYSLMNVPLGCSWEARYWLAPLYANHDH